MFYWLFTTGREIAAGLIVPLLCLTLLMPVVSSVLLGVGIQRTSEQQTTRRRQVIRLLAFVIVLVGITAVYVTLLGDLALQPARGRQTSNGFIRALAGGPTSIDQGRLFLFGALLASAGLDRLLHHAEVMVITGASFRAQGRQQLEQEVLLAQQQAGS